MFSTFEIVLISGGVVFAVQSLQPPSRWDIRTRQVAGGWQRALSERNRWGLKVSQGISSPVTSAQVFRERTCRHAIGASRGPWVWYAWYRFGHDIYRSIVPEYSTKHCSVYRDGVMRCQKPSSEHMAEWRWISYSWFPTQVSEPGSTQVQKLRMGPHGVGDGAVVLRSPLSFELSDLERHSASMILSTRVASTSCKSSCSHPVFLLSSSRCFL